MPRHDNSAIHRTFRTGPSSSISGYGILRIRSPRRPRNCQCVCCPDGSHCACSDSPISNRHLEPMRQSLPQCLQFRLHRSVHSQNRRFMGWVSISVLNAARLTSSATRFGNGIWQFMYKVYEKIFESARAQHVETGSGLDVGFELARIFQMFRMSGEIPERLLAFKRYVKHEVAIR